MIQAEHYVTCFDFKFLIQGLTLYESLSNNENMFVLWILCLDEKVYRHLKNKNLKNAKILELNNFETPELLKLKETRTRPEYYWTLTPFIPEWIFDSEKSIDRLTYLDADMFFFKNPSKIFNEFEISSKSILITEHAFDPMYSDMVKFGKFCVQWITYKRGKSIKVIKWWQKKCLEWCYSKLEEDRFGDQKYLDKWPELFSNEIHILKNKNLILAPWNQSKFSSEMVLWHFHGFRLLNNYKILLSSYYEISSEVMDNVYKFYINRIKSKLDKDTYLPEESFKYNILLNYIVYIIKNLNVFLQTFNLKALNPNIKVFRLKK